MKLAFISSQLEYTNMGVLWWSFCALSAHPSPLHFGPVLHLPLPLPPSNPLIIIPLFFHDLPPVSSSNLNFLLSSSASLSLSDLLVSSSCDITGHCSPLGLDTRPRCQATAVKGLSVSVCAACACYVCVYVCL